MCVFTNSGRLPLRVATLAISTFLTTSCASQLGSQSPNDGSNEEYYDDRDPDETSPEGDRDEPVATNPAAPVLVRRTPTSSGPLDGDAAGLALFGASDGLDACYRSHLDASVDAGIVFIVLDVLPSGEVEDVLIGYSDMSDSVFLGCLERTLSDVEMPAAEGSSVVQAHLVFGAADVERGRSLMRAYRTARDGRELDETVPLSEIGRNVQGCYERVFRGRQGEPGRLVLNLSLDDDGSIASVAIAEDDFDGRLDACVRTTVEKLRLEREEGESDQLVYPVILQPGRPDATPTETDEGSSS